jgi:hypothetical protein
MRRLFALEGFEIDIKKGIKTVDVIFAAILLGELAGAEGFEPSPSSLTVRCPTSWTTPQQLTAPTSAPKVHSGHTGARYSAAEEDGKESSKDSMTVKDDKLLRRKKNCMGRN